MKTYTTINYKDLSLEEVERIGLRIHHIDGRNNGLLYNGKCIVSVPVNGCDFSINDYLEENPDIINCGNDLDRFVSIVSVDINSNKP